MLTTKLIFAMVGVTEGLGKEEEEECGYIYLHMKKYNMKHVKESLLVSKATIEIPFSDFPASLLDALRYSSERIMM
jgi:hypothetical protein